MADPTHVFISYSHEDADIVDRFKAVLVDAGTVIWLDHEQLKPGTPDWQDAVWKGILQATHVIYAASPTAARSPFVIHEIEIARGEGKEVLPFWIRGEKWYQSTPFGWILAHYTDGRGANYNAGLAELLKALGVIAQSDEDKDRKDHTPTKTHLFSPGRSLPSIPEKLIKLGFVGINRMGTPAIIPPLVPVHAGFFLMGSDQAIEKHASEWESPQDYVYINAFQIGKYPVTVAEYELAVRAGVVSEPPSWKPGKLLVEFHWEDRETTWETQKQHPDHPVVCVSWQDVQKYIAWFRKVTKQTEWRMPSEAQWEKASRWDPAHNLSRRYPWGDRFDKDRCNTWVSGIRATTPIGSYPDNDALRCGASPYGAEDMCGNVLEWTRSLRKRYPYVSTDGREDLNSTESRVLRGGSGCTYPIYSRPAFRSVYPPDFTDGYVGFRLVFENLVHPIITSS